MKLVQILNSSATRTINVMSAIPSADIYGINLSRAFEERYGFLESPKTAEGFDFNNVVTFRHGYFKGNVLDLVELASGGVRVRSNRGGTELCDEAIDDMVNFAHEAGIAFTEGSNQRIYDSAVEVELGGNFSALFSALEGVGADIGNRLGSYGGQLTLITVSALQCLVNWKVMRRRHFALNAALVTRLKRVCFFRLRRYQREITWRF